MPGTRAGFDLDRPWQLHPQVSVRPERFGALLYHFGTRRLSFLKSPALLTVVSSLGDVPSARVACLAAGVTEAELADMDDADRQMFLAEMGQTESGLARLIRAAFALLGLQTYFTAGVKEVRAWTIHVGDTAPQAAGVIHTDFERGFIRAQTIAYDDFIAHGGEHGAKDAGRMRAEGKEYVVKDGDVLNFLFNV